MLQFRPVPSKKDCLTAYTGNETDVVIPDGVGSILGAFLDNTEVTSVEIPDSVTKIDSSAFEGCTSLTNIEIPDSVIQIGGYAFSGCSALTSIVISEFVIYIGPSAFSNCTSLKNVCILNPDVERISDGFTRTEYDFVVYGYGGSTAEAFARTLSKTFVALDDLDLDEVLANIQRETVALPTSTTIDSLENTQWLYMVSMVDGKSEDVSGKSMFLYFLEDGEVEISWGTQTGYYYDNDNDYSNGFKVNMGGDLANSYVNDGVLTIESTDGSYMLRFELW